MKLFNNSDYSCLSRSLIHFTYLGHLYILSCFPTNFYWLCRCHASPWFFPNWSFLLPTNDQSTVCIACFEHTWSIKLVHLQGLHLGMQWVVQSVQIVASVHACANGFFYSYSLLNSFSTSLCLCHRLWLMSVVLCIGSELNRCQGNTDQFERTQFDWPRRRIRALILSQTTVLVDDSSLVSSANVGQAVLFIRSALHPPRHSQRNPTTA